MIAGDRAVYSVFYNSNGAASTNGLVIVSISVGDGYTDLWSYYANATAYTQWKVLGEKELTDYNFTELVVTDLGTATIDGKSCRGFRYYGTDMQFFKTKVYDDSSATSEYGIVFKSGMVRMESVEGYTYSLTISNGVIKATKVE